MANFSPLQPLDEHNQRLRSHVHPVDWTNPTPAGRYNLVVIGAGTAGLVTAAGAAGLGAKVALVESGLMGGDCLNVGCVPSKALIAAARAARSAGNANSFGVNVTGKADVDFAQVMNRMRRLRADISPADSAARFRDLGVDVFLGQATFRDSESIEVGGQTLRFRRAVIATGARAAAPPIDGLESVDYLTNETLFSLTELPARLGVIGAGPIGCEMAQTFAQLGSEVVLIESSHGVLPKEERDAAEIVEKSIKRDGVELRCCVRGLQVAREGSDIRLSVDSHGAQHATVVDQLLVAVGRAPNVEELQLDRAGVEFNEQGVVVNDYLQTTQSNIYAAGDICSKFQFTHAADFMARAVIQNALFKGWSKLSSLTIPWCTYTTPELAHVGLSPSEAESQGIELDTFEQPLGDVDRAILEGDEEGFVRVHVKRGSDQILGATIVAADAGELISEITLAMTHSLGLKRIGSTIHPYPTVADAIRKLGDQYNRTRLTPAVKSLMQRWLQWTR